ncbi:binding-protein-dependent transport systems inner membrane component [Cellulomonas flavigena DSM 20109]|uniref:Binding-protein-dependent transport systems inner membrane component n=1 Tax=Cellulomonas flavigena (strain ATCC 482 / DSM 20109 / BCRC 11376 / JCM 18109 / NBRC 3775 / NCIMB 8073 / NRS 134) TaxID=446466 RepID=D5UHG9_CELFN|nr:sugar ABC transporter permease [Cellulomonas flavigena]ADG75290.1 binding-protein-dependent transport systems inner membrane component [Cellulomonas flavigena DSM 20109]
MATSTTQSRAGRRLPDSPRTPRRVGFSQKLSRWDVKVSPYLYISPFFILFGLTGLFPLAYTAYVSVYDWHLLGGQGDFVGFENFAFVFQEPNFWKGLRNTFSIFLLSTIPQLMVAIVLAALLDANLRAKTFWRMGVLVPYVIAPVAVSLIFGKIFADQSGLANSILGTFGVEPIRWHGSVLPSHMAVATMVNFRWTGYNTLILLAAMQAVPRELYEAAVIDGATRLRQFFSITIPQIRPTLIFVVITSTIGGLQIFDEPRLFDQIGQGGPGRQWMTVTMYIYELGFGNQKSFGRAAAVAWVLFLIILAVGLLNFWLTQRIASDATPQARKSRRKKVKR